MLIIKLKVEMETKIEINYQSNINAMMSGWTILSGRTDWNLVNEGKGKREFYYRTHFLNEPWMQDNLPCWVERGKSQQLTENKNMFKVGDRVWFKSTVGFYKHRLGKTGTIVKLQEAGGLGSLKVLLDDGEEAHTSYQYISDLELISSGETKGTTMTMDDEIPKTLSVMERFLADADTQILIKAGYLKDGQLTQKAKDTISVLQFQTFKTQLVATATEELAEVK